LTGVMQTLAFELERIRLAKSSNKLDMEIELI
jgi:hypothetical protein